MALLRTLRLAIPRSSHAVYGLGLLLRTAAGEVAREGRLRWLIASLVVNLGILATFKYFDFFGDSANDLLRAMGIDIHLPVLSVALPIGISFYTFHGISYVFDVFRKQIEPTRSLLDYACFVAYFPQLVAGPIGQAKNQLPQIEHVRNRPRSRIRRRCRRSHPGRAGQEGRHRRRRGWRGE